VGAGEGVLVAGAGDRTGALEQATKLPTIAQPNHRHKRCCMTLILLEALGAGLLLVLIVWWTMFSGRDRGEPPQERSDVTTPSVDAVSAQADQDAGDAQPPKPQG
jgi:hypothetical protein